MKYKYNDNELLYLFSEGIEEALEILCEKYVGLIWKRIISFKIQERFKEDFFQEGLFALLVAIRSYNDSYKKTFNKYFDLILQRRFIKILRKEKNYIYNVTLYDDYNDLPITLNEYPEVEYEKEVKLGMLSKREKEVYLLLADGKTVKEISEILNINSKSVYNCIFRIKSKTS